MNLSRRIKKLEAARFDANGLVPHSPQWREYWGEKLHRFANGEDVDLSGLTLEVTNWIIAEADREEQEEALAKSSGQSE